jgi:hypothetical protein
MMRLKMRPRAMTTLFLTVVMMTSCDKKETIGTTDSGTTNDVLEVDTTANLPIEDLTTLVGNTYLVDFLPGYWSTPKNVGQEIGEYVQGLLFQILGVDVTACLRPDGLRGFPHGTREDHRGADTRPWPLRVSSSIRARASTTACWTR